MGNKSETWSDGMKKKWNVLWSKTTLRYLEYFHLDWSNSIRKGGPNSLKWRLHHSIRGEHSGRIIEREWWREYSRGISVNSHYSAWLNLRGVHVLHENAWFWLSVGNGSIVIRVSYVHHHMLLANVSSCKHIHDNRIKNRTTDITASKDKFPAK